MAMGSESMPTINEFFNDNLLMNTADDKQSNSVLLDERFRVILY